MSIKTEFRKKLTEAKYLVNPENLDRVVDKMGDNDTVKIVDENSEEPIDEKSVSKSQQRFMGMVKKCKEDGECPSKSVSKVAKDMKMSDVEDFASTKHKGLPEKVSEYEIIKPKMTKKEIQETVLKFIDNEK